MSNNQYQFDTIQAGQPRLYPGQAASGRLGERSRAYRALWAYKSRNPGSGLRSRSNGGTLEVYREGSK